MFVDADGWLARRRDRCIGRRGARRGWLSSDHAAPTGARVLFAAPTARLFAALLNWVGEDALIGINDAFSTGRPSGLRTDLDGDAGRLGSPLRKQ